MQGCWNLYFLMLMQISVRIQSLWKVRLVTRRCIMQARVSPGTMVRLLHCGLKVVGSSHRKQPPQTLHIGRSFVHWVSPFRCIMQALSYFATN